MKLFLATSDNSSHILPSFAWLLDKYVPEIDEVIVLGYGTFPELPERYTTVSLAPKQRSADEWSTRLFEYFGSIKDEYVLFGLDDFLPTRPMDIELLLKVTKYMVKNNAMRYELGVGHSWHQYTLPVDDLIYQYGQNSLYRISTQFSVWNRNYLLKHLAGKLDAGDFEKRGSEQAMNDNQLIIATRGMIAWDWVQAGALSSRHPNKINVLGINHEDVEQMIELGLLERDKLQLGMNIENNPKYK